MTPTRLSALVALVEAGVRGVVNIGGKRRSFRDILVDEGYVGFREIERKDLRSSAEGERSELAYPFPADTSVNTAKFEALGLDWRNV